MRSRSTRRSLALAVAVAMTVAPTAAMAQEGTGDGRELPVPGDDVEAFALNASAGSGPRVVLEWPAQASAAAYEVYMDRDVASEEPGWERLDVEPERTRDDDVLRVVLDADDLPERRSPDGQDLLAFAVLAVDASGEPVAEGRSAVDLSSDAFWQRDPYRDEELAEPAVASGTFLGALALAVALIAAVAYIGYRRRG